ncbi:MAG TPA: hypothetical protein VFT95_05805 [Micromonosporaceae bacterium]|nr:hypothetical protein [Micromonosporaceae bacterium]
MTEAITHEPGDTVTLVSRMLFNDDQSRQGTVTAVADDGRVTAEFPQDASFPLVVTSDAEHFVHVRKAPEILGFIVLIYERGRWGDDWDGTVHTTLAAGNDALAKARAAGYPAVLTQAQPVGPVPDVSAEVGAAA